MSGALSGSASCTRVTRADTSGRERSHPQSAATSSSAAVAASGTAARSFQPERDAACAAMVDPGSAYVALESASANAFAVEKRSAGNFSSAFATAAATFGGTDFRSSVTGRARSVMIFMMICCAEFPIWGGSPVSIS